MQQRMLDIVKQYDNYTTVFALQDDEKTNSKSVAFAQTISQYMCNILAVNLKYFAKQLHGSFWRTHVIHVLEEHGFTDQEIAEAIKNFK